MPRCQRRWPGFPVVVAEVLVNGEGAVTGNYRVLCSFGLSETAVTRSALWQVGPHDPTLECFPALANLLASWHADASKVVRIPNVATASANHNAMGGAKNVGCCNCKKGQCGNGNCSCFKANLRCSSKCHHGDHSRCQNMEGP